MEFYHPQQLIERENMVEISEDEDTYDSPQKEQRRKDKIMDDRVNELRIRKEAELEQKRRREALLAKKRKLENERLALAKAMRAAGGTTSASGAVIKKTININNLPSMAPTTVKPTVSKEYTAINPKLEALKKKKARSVYASGEETRDTEPDRPNSGRSGLSRMTGNMTAAMTVMTGG
jgi:predicted metal-dependent hydrolase